jgi:hypothetical protein
VVAVPVALLKTTVTFCAGAPVVVAKLPRRQRVVQLVPTHLLTLRQPLCPRGRAKCRGNPGAIRQ